MSTTNNPTQERIDFLLALLDGQGWMKSKFITEFDERELRSIANASNGEIISGQRGYCLRSEATADEVLHAIAWLRHQARAMLLRADQIEDASVSRTQPWLFEEVGA